MNNTNTSIKNIQKDSYKIFYINLAMDKKKNADTLHMLHREFREIPYKRIEAIYGKDLSDQYINDTVNIDLYKKHTAYEIKKGTVGCYLSHVKAWEEFIKSDSEFALILEDDTRIKEPYKKDIKNILSELATKKDNWDILSISHKKKPKLTMGSFSAGKKVFFFHAYLQTLHNAGMYIINRKTAENMIINAFPMEMPLDVYFNKYWEFGDDIKFRGLFPIISFHDEKYVSSRLLTDYDKTNELSSVEKIYYRNREYKRKFPRKKIYSYVLIKFILRSKINFTYLYFNLRGFIKN